VSLTNNPQGESAVWTFSLWSIHFPIIWRLPCDYFILY